MYISLFKTLLGNYTTLFFISLLLILPMVISQQSYAQGSVCGNGTVEAEEDCDDVQPEHDRSISPAPVC